MVASSTAKLSLKVFCLLLVSCSTTKETSRSLISDFIAEKNFRVSDTLDLYFFPPLRTYSGNNGRSDLITSDTTRPIQHHARIIRHTTANVADTTRYKVNEQEQVTKIKQPPPELVTTGEKICWVLLIFFGFVFIASLILVIWKLLRLTGSQ